MPEVETLLVAFVFAATVILLMWRPGGMNEAAPTTAGALVLLMLGAVKLAELGEIFEIVSGAAITILSTIVMSIVLESIGFFRWAAYNVIVYARGSGIRLYWLVLLLCFLMTLFFNNDGSILITTPIIIQVGRMLRLKPHQHMPYLIGGALIATAASAPIGVSNLANLIALRIVGLDLNTYAWYMLVPSMAGIVTIAALLYAITKSRLPRRILRMSPGPGEAEGLPDPSAAARKWIHGAQRQDANAFHPLRSRDEPAYPWGLFRTCIGIVIGIRAGFFAGSALGVPIEWIAIFGAALLIAVRWIWAGVSPSDLIKRTPWHILLFAFSIYVIVAGLRNVGLTEWIVRESEPYIAAGGLSSILWTGGLLTVMSNMLNNLPSVMLGTLALTDMALDDRTLQIAYLANIIGSDVGALLTPLGTLATLIWMFILKQHGIRISWAAYIGIAIRVVPAGLAVSLIGLYLWTWWMA